MFGFQQRDITDITVILDRSGSMAGIAEETVDGFASFIEKQAKVPGDCRVTLVQFDHHYEVVYRHRPLHRVPRLKLIPRGSTALLDAMGRTITHQARVLATSPPHHRPSRVMIVVITDGMENSSREFSREQVFGLTKLYTDRYDWQFVYLGANQDAIAVAGQLGIDPRVAMTYQAGCRGTANAWDGMASLVARKRQARPDTMHDACFTSQERDAAREAD